MDLQSQQQGSLLLSAVNLPGGVQRRRNAEDELAMRSVFREGDLISVSTRGSSSVSVSVCVWGGETAHSGGAMPRTSSRCAASFGRAASISVSCKRGRGKC